MEEKQPKSTPYCVGDGNALDVHNTSDSHDVINKDSRSFDYSDSHNITNVYVGKSPEDLTLSERKTEYRDICKRLIRNGIIDKEVRKQLNEMIEKLSLDRNDARQIENDIKESMGSSQYLNRADQAMFDYIVTDLNSKNPNIQECLFKLEALAKRVEQEEVQFYYYLLLAAQEPSELAHKYENRDCDDYWQSYWAYVAYLRLGVYKNAEEVLGSLNNWSDKPSSNVLLAQCVGLLYNSLLRGVEENAQHRVLEMMNNCTTLSRSLYPLKNTVIELAHCSRQELNDVARTISNLYRNIFDLDKVFRNLTSAQKLKPNIDNQNDIKEKSPVSESNISIESTSKSSKKKILYVVAGIIVVLFAFMQVFGPKDNDSDMQNTSVSTTINEKTEGTLNNNTKTANESKTKKTVNGQSSSQRNVTTKKNTYVAQSKSSSRPATNGQLSSSKDVRMQSSANKKVTNVEQKNTRTTISQASPSIMSASELINKGKSYMNKFKDDKAYECFLKASQMDNATAFYYLGELFYNGGNFIERSYPKAFQYYQHAANSGLAKAQYMLGMMYRSGYGCEKNLSNAKYWLNKSAMQGYSKAEEILDRI